MLFLPSFLVLLFVFFLLFSSTHGLLLLPYHSFIISSISPSFHFFYFYLSTPLPHHLILIFLPSFLPSYCCSFHSSLRLPTLFPNFLPLFPPFFNPALNFLFLVSFIKYIFLSFSVFPCCYCDLLFLLPSILPSFLPSFLRYCLCTLLLYFFSFLVISTLLIVTCVVPFFHSFSLFTCFSFFLPPFFLNLSCSQVILHTRTNTQHVIKKKLEEEK